MEGTAGLGGEKKGACDLMTIGGYIQSKEELTRRMRLTAKICRENDRCRDRTRLVRYRRSRTDAKAHCKQYMSMGHQTVSTLHAMCKEAANVILDDRVGRLTGTLL